jgi:hypothetical protein
VACCSFVSCTFCFVPLYSSVLQLTTHNQCTDCIR